MVFGEFWQADTARLDLPRGTHGCRGWLTGPPLSSDRGAMADEPFNVTVEVGFDEVLGALSFLIGTGT